MTSYAIPPSDVFPRAHRAIAYVLGGGDLATWEQQHGACTPAERAHVLTQVTAYRRSEQRAAAARQTATSP